MIAAFRPLPVAFRPIPPPGAARRPANATAWLARYHEMLMMIDLLDRLPDLVDDIRDWRTDVGAGFDPLVEGRLAWTPRSPFAMRALIAMAKGLDTLGQAAADACGDDALGHPDIVAQCQGFGAQMRGLLERVSALLADVEDFSLGDAQRRSDRVFAHVAPDR